MTRLLKSKSKVSETLIRELLFADDAALTSHSVTGLQRLIDRFNDACIEFGLTVSLKKKQWSWLRMPTRFHLSTSTNTCWR